VQIVAIKPDALVVSTTGEYNNEDPGAEPLKYQHEVSLREAQMQQLEFIPSDGGDAGEQSLDEYADEPTVGPENTTPQPPNPVSDQHIGSMEKFAPMSEYDRYFGGEAGAAAKAKASMIKQYGEEKGEEVFYATVNKKRKEKGETKDSAVEIDDSHCPRCSGEHLASVMSSPTSSFHECFRCGHTWETKEEDYTDENTAGRQWILDDSGPGGDDFFAEMERHKARRSQSSRNIADIAQRDPRLQAIKERLEENASHREAGRRFTPREQREFIDEPGTARNTDKLDLGGTHYEVRSYIDRGYGRGADGENVRDEELFLGI
jgi:hypothetical protein